MSDPIPARTSSQTTAPGMRSGPSPSTHNSVVPSSEAFLTPSTHLVVSETTTEHLHSPTDEALSPPYSITPPEPHLPLRRRSSEKLKQRAAQLGVHVATALPEKATTPTSPTFPGNERPSSMLRTDMESPATSANTSPVIGQMEGDSPWSRPYPRRLQSLGRERGISAASQQTSASEPLPRHRLRTSTSIPDYVPIRAPLPHRNFTATNVRPDRPYNSVRDSYQSSLRREPLPWMESADEVRSSLKSALTNASSSMYTSGTERSSFMTKNSSATDISMATTSASEWVEAQEEGMSVEDAILMYADGFTDDPVEDETIRIRGEDIKIPPIRIPSVLAPIQPSAISRRRSATDLTPVRESVLKSPQSLRPPSPEIRTSTQIISAGWRDSRFPPEPRASLTPVKRDRYGFKKCSQNITAEQYDAWNHDYIAYVDRRRKKWVELMQQHGLPTENPQRFPERSDKVKRYIRKGIPPEWRGAAWFWYAGGPQRLAKEPGLYQHRLNEVPTKLSETDREHIERDLNRTFPDNIRFKPDPVSKATDSGVDVAVGQELSQTDDETAIVRSLRRVLQAFAIHNTNIGYCQSLNFLVGLLLLFLDDEEKAFHMLDIITKVYLPGTHSIVLEANNDVGILMDTVRETMPTIWTKINDREGNTAVQSPLRHRHYAPIPASDLPTVSLALTSWFMSLFIGTLPIESVLRVWDSLFYEGSKTLFRIALAIFKTAEPDIRAVNDGMEIFQLVQTIPRRLLDVNKLMETCFKRRNGFGHLSQKVIDERRVERRKLAREDRARAKGLNGAAARAATQVVDRTEDSREKPPGPIRRAASRARFMRRKGRDGEEGVGADVGRRDVLGH